MIFSRNNQFSRAQAITADAASTDIIDMGTSAFPRNRDLGFGIKVPILIQVVEAFNNLTTLNIAIQCAPVENFASGVKTVAQETIPLAELVPGRRFFLDYVPQGTTERFLRVFYDVTGTAPTTGRITAGIVASEHQTN